MTNRILSRESFPCQSESTCCLGQRLGVLAGIFFPVDLAPFGLGPRAAGALLALASGAVAGFMKIKRLSPERYLFRRLRYALRQGLGVWLVPDLAVR